MWIGWSQPPPPFFRVQISRVPNLGAAETRPKSAVEHAAVVGLDAPRADRTTVTGSLVVWLAPRAELERARRAPPGCSTGRGSGSCAAGTWLTSGVAGLRTMRNSRNLPTQGSDELPESASASVRSSAGLLPSWCSARFTIQTLSPDAVAREVDDDVVALGDALLVELRERHRVRQQVAVVGDLDHRSSRHAERDLEEARHAGVQDAEAVLAPLHLEERLVGEVHGHHGRRGSRRSRRCPSRAGRCASQALSASIRLTS